MGNSSIRHSIHIKSRTLSYNYSKGLLAQDLVNKGIDYITAYDISLKIQDRIIDKFPENESIVIDEDAYYRILLEVAEEVLDKVMFDRLVKINQRIEDDKPIIILLAGGKGGGGTNIAKKLAKRFSIPQFISTDTITEILKKVLAPELAPELHSKPYSAYKKLRPVHSVLYDSVLLGYVENGRYVTDAIEALIKRALVEGVSIIIRGEQIIPRYISEELLKHKNVYFTAIDVPSERLHLRNLIRTSFDDERDDLIINFAKIRRISKYITDQTKEMKLPLIPSHMKENEATEFVTDMIIKQ